AGDDLVFPAGAQRKTGQIIGVTIGTAFNSITYSGSGYEVLSSNSIAPRSITDNAGGLTTFNSSLLYPSTSSTLSQVTITVNTFVGSLKLGGPISGSVDLDKEGDGLLTLAHANTYAGNTQVDAGTLALEDDLALGSAATPTATVTNV